MNSTFAQQDSGVQFSPSVRLQLEEYRNLTRRHLDRFPGLFTNLTGLESSVAWAPTFPHRWTEKDLPTRSRVCQRITTKNAAALDRCKNCGLRHLELTLKAGPAGHLFLCHEGVRNFWFAMNVRHCTVGIGFVQTLDGDRRHFSGSAGGRKVSERPLSSVAGVIHPHPALSKAMSLSAFKQIAKLLQLILLHAEISTVADLRKKDLARVRKALLASRAMETRLREELRRTMPVLDPEAPALEMESHSRKVVRVLLDWIGRDYCRPLTLGDCAIKLGLNVSYLSHVFCTAVGMPFKAYLTELRMEKARELLSDPTRSVSEIAFAVGYASENRFRIAFRKATGLSPRSWRDTVTMNPISSAAHPSNRDDGFAQSSPGLH